MAHCHGRPAPFADRFTGDGAPFQPLAVGSVRPKIFNIKERVCVLSTDRRRVLLGGGALLGIAFTSGAARQGDGADAVGLSSLTGPLAGGGADDESGDDDGTGTSGGESSDEEGSVGDGADDSGSGGDSDEQGGSEGDGGTDSGGDGSDSGDGESDDDEQPGGDGVPGFSASTAKAEAGADGVEITDVARRGETVGLRFRTAAADEAALRDDLESALAAISAAIEDAEAFDEGVETVLVDVYHVEREESRESAVDPRAAIDYRDGDISMDEYLEEL